MEPEILIILLISVETTMLDLRTVGSLFSSCSVSPRSSRSAESVYSNQWYVVS